MTVTDDIKAGMRRLIAEKGDKVEFTQDYDGKPKASSYGWRDWQAADHIAGRERNEQEQEHGSPKCEWIVPEGITVHEETYSMFAGTFVGNEDEVGLNAPGCHCKCGKYKDVTLRVTCSLGEAIKTLVGYDTTRQMEL